MTTNEFRVFGPPGTGKTTFLGSQIRKWVPEYGADNIIVASFTRAAAREVAGRDLPIRREQIGTLHAFAFRALGLNKDEVAESHIDEFNESQSTYKLSGGNNDAMEDAAFGVGGNVEDDATMMKAQVLRARMVPTDSPLWGTTALALHNAWMRWCAEAEYTDFTGMIERALVEVPIAPNNPSVGLFDEAQDFTPLELALVRSWGQHMEVSLLAGDDDQCIYGFKGASPYVFLDPPVDDAHRRVLSQSYRVPGKVHRLSQAWVHQLHRREPKEYAPRLEDDAVVEGSVRATDGGYNEPDELVKRASAAADDGKTVMILASCSYMLKPIIASLRENGVPFHNPYRTANPTWNPLVHGGRARRMPVDRLLAFLRPDRDVWGDFSRMWTNADAWAFVELMRAKDLSLFKHGGKTWMERQPRETPASTPDMHDNLWLDPNCDEVLRLENCDLEELRRQIMATKMKPYEFPLTVARKRGAATLRSTPQITVGTIHSVKGGQADVVYLLPDLSAQGYDQWSQPSTRDEIVRLFYVGMTRARSELVLCESGARAVPLIDFARSAA